MLEVLLVLVLVSISCSLIGSVLVLQHQSLLADALSHSVLLGIVLGFFVSGNLDSPLLMMGATLFGVLSVFIIDVLHTQKLAHDAATGLVFSFFFAVAVILISLFARNVHLDMDIVLMGEVLFAPLHRMEIAGVSVPVSVVKSSLTLLANGAFFIALYQPLKVFLFDKTQAQLAGLPVKWVQFFLLLLVSLTTVLSFDAIGSMTVIVFLVAPAMTVLPWVSHLWQLLLGAVLSGVVAVSLGYMVASAFDLTMSGSCAVVSLLVFLLSVVVRKHVPSRQQKTSY